MRVLEAWAEGLDAISITDHQPVPRSHTETKDCNVSYNKAFPMAESKGITLIKGLEDYRERSCWTLECPFYQRL